MKTIGTLKEIGAQVGDVVELVYNGIHEGIGVGETGEVYFDGSEFLTRGDGMNRGDTFGHKFRILTRAAKSPVRTVTRKEIVPGVYGKVQVFGSGYICTEMMLASDLTAAIKTLTEIRDAMAGDE